MIRRDGIVIWPAYFEKRLSRKRGRRISSKLASENVSAETIARVCRSLGLDCEVVEGAYPKMWWRKTGYVIVKNSGLKKSELIRKIAEHMRRK